MAVSRHAKDPVGQPSLQCATRGTMKRFIQLTSSPLGSETEHPGDVERGGVQTATELAARFASVRLLDERARTKVSP